MQVISEFIKLSLPCFEITQWLLYNFIKSVNTESFIIINIKSNKKFFDVVCWGSSKSCEVCRVHVARLQQRQWCTGTIIPLGLYEALFFKDFYIVLNLFINRFVTLIIDSVLVRKCSMRGIKWEGKFRKFLMICKSLH